MFTDEAKYELKSKGWPDEYIEQYKNHPIISKADGAYFDDRLWETLKYTPEQDLLCRIRLKVENEKFDVDYFKYIMRTFDDMLLIYKKKLQKEKLEKMEQDF